MDKAQAALEAAQSGTTAERNQRIAALNELVGPAARIVVRDIGSGRETTIDTGTVSKASVLFGAGDTIVFAGANERGAPQQIYVAGAGKAATAVTTDPTEKVLGTLNRRGTSLLFTTRLPGSGRGGRGGGANAANATTPAATSPASTTSPAAAETAAPAPAAAGGRGRGAGGAIAPTRFGVMAIPEGTITMVTGSSPAFSRDGGTLVFVGRNGDEQGVMAASSSEPGLAAVVRKGPERIESPAASDGGSRIAFQMMSRDDWEIVTVGRDGTGETRLTRDPQHDLLPQFLSGDRLLSVVGEARHRRSFVYDLATGQQTRLFHNNTVRTIAPEYSWEAERRRQQAPDRRRAGRQHRLARARRLPGRPHEAGHARGGAGPRRRQPRRRRVAPRPRPAPVRAARGRHHGDGRRGLGAASLRLPEGALRLRLEAHHPPGEQARVGVPLRHLQVVRLRARDAVVRSRERARRQDRQRAGEAHRHRPPRGHLRRQQPLRLGRDRSRRRRRLVGHRGAARDGADHGAAAAAGDDRLRLVHRRRSRPARQPRIRPPRRRRQAPDRRRPQQRHGRLGQRLQARQHHPLFEPRHPRHPARGGDAVQPA